MKQCSRNVQPQSISCAAAVWKLGKGRPELDQQLFYTFPKHYLEFVVPLPRSYLDIVWKLSRHWLEIVKRLSGLYIEISRTSLDMVYSFFRSCLDSEWGPPRPTMTISYRFSFTACWPRLAGLIYVCVCGCCQRAIRCIIIMGDLHCGHLTLSWTFANYGTWALLTMRRLPYVLVACA